METPTMKDLARNLILSLALGGLAFGCAGGAGGDGGGGGGGGTSFNPQFQLPADGAMVESAFQLEVSGSGVVRVFFKIDGNLLLEDVDAPFMVEIDPNDYDRRDYRLVITAQASSGAEAKQTITLNFNKPRKPAAEILAEIAALGAGEWYEIPESHLREVSWPWVGAERGDITGMIEAVSGGTYDTKRERLLVWGGGQGAYGGNEIYGFDLATMRWMRLNDPSMFAVGEEKNPFNRPQHPDGAPVQRHTFDYVEYVPEPFDLFVVGGGSSVWRDGFRDTQTYTLDLETLVWKTLPDTPSASAGAVSAVAPDGRFWMQGAQDDTRAHLAVLDLGTEMWQQHVTWDDGFRFLDQNAEIDPVRNLFVATGVAGTYVWDLDNPDVDATRLMTTGDTVIELAKGPGFAYHPGRDVMVAWHGGLVYTLDLDTATWTAVPHAGSVTPPTAAPRGTFGRWRYSATYDVFIVVNSADANVYVYRLP
jgi:hypothetical protein